MRRLVTIGAAASAVLCAAASALWVRSYRAADDVRWGSPEAVWSVWSARGWVGWNNAPAVQAARSRAAAHRDARDQLDFEHRWELNRLRRHLPPTPEDAAAYAAAVQRADDFYRAELAGLAPAPVVPHPQSWTVPHMALVVPAAAMPAYLARRRLARWRHRRRSACLQCVRCGYALRATPARCPECGAVSPMVATAHTATA